ncbi:hypothetical protein ACFOGG_07605 [Brenneria rubrifaciens]|uniref:hypothetical protein n=1 Tax=Brenneria rubrifaciens TaxID=55213 RepID=UPI0036206542
MTSADHQVSFRPRIRHVKPADIKRVHQPLCRVRRESAEADTIMDDLNNRIAAG